MSAVIVNLAQYKHDNELIWSAYLQHRHNKVSHEMAVIHVARETGLSLQRIRISTSRQSLRRNYSVQKGTFQHG